LHLKPLRATLVFLFAASLVACGAQQGTLPTTMSSPTMGSSNPYSASVHGAIGSSNMNMSMGMTPPNITHPGPITGKPTRLIVAGPPPTPLCVDSSGNMEACVVGTYKNPGTTFGIPTGGGTGGGPGTCGFNQVNCQPCSTGQGNAGCGVPVAHVRGPAKYNEGCTNEAQLIGHSVPGTGVSMSTAIINEYPINMPLTPVGGNIAGLLIGYIYTTWGGTAYFEPVASAVSAGVVSIGVSGYINVGPNSLTQNINKYMGTLGKILNKKVKAGIDGGNDACFSSNWDGTYPS
ncbi:MAG: hypothetical protein ACYDA1_05255, partial [Vulcanimicrobiaceae bacterium]